MADINSKILIFGGAFNPPHVGHLHILKAAIKYIQPEQTLVCVDKISPWKDSSQLVPYSYRVDMVNNLLVNEIKYSIYPNTNKLVYTCDILQELANTNPEWDMYFLVGQDQYELITTWNNYEQINSLATIVCYRRGDKPIKRIHDKHIILTDPQFPCSSSDIRAQATLKDLGQKNLDYVKEHGLYLQNKIKPYMSERRYQHTLRVLDTISKIANGNHFSDEDLLRCQTAALLHDIAKQYTDQQLRSIVSNDELASFPSYHCAHGLAGSRLAAKDFGIKDEAILDAISNHVIFKDLNSNNKVAKALFLADKLEPARTEADIANRAKLLDEAIEDCEQTFSKVYKLNGEKY